MPTPATSVANFIAEARRLFPGVAISLVTAFSAMYLSAQYDAPVMLFALLLGMAMNFLSEQDACCPGINFCTKKVLRIGVALLGLRITLDQVQSVGYDNLILVSLAVGLTMAFGMFLAVRLGRTKHFGLLTGGSVAICGASAAMAIAAVMPNHPDREAQLVFTVLMVTLLSTVAMIFYPLIAAQLQFTDLQAGVFLGATIHDVAQVVGAGYSMSQETGDYATITKLYRVIMLIPVFLVLGLMLRKDAAGRSEDENGGDGGSAMPIPWFVLGFVAFLIAVSFKLIPQPVVEQGLGLSRLLLVTAIAALGMKTNPRVLFKGSTGAIALIVFETLFLLAVILIWMTLGGG